MSRPISDYALLSDSHSAALVSLDGVVEWLCLPRFDSPSVFGRLLDEDAGHWSLRPRGVTSARRHYRGRSLVLETQLSTSTGRGMLVEALAFGEGERGHSIGLGSPHVLVRELTCLEGEFEVEEEVVPRPGYGAEIPRVEAVAGGARFAFPGGRLVLSTEGTLEAQSGGVRGRARLAAGQSYRSALGYVPASEPPPGSLSGERIAQLIEDATEGWRTWSSSHQNYDGPWSEMVYHSGVVMQGLTYRPTGAMVAAPTTSLPEEVGGVRNWDYRYSWLRDSSMTLQALWVAACPDEAGEYFRWMAGTAERDESQGLDLQILYGIGGERDLPERELPHLRGWRDSRPVRVGNGAGGQRQIDIYGEVIDAAYRLLPTVDILSPESTRFLVRLADTAAAVWTKPDQGIWEVRGGPRHFVYSKVMCWVALDRAIAMADRLGASDRVATWAQAREAIRKAVESRGWNARLGAFTQSFDDDQLDASVLMLGITGFVSPSDPRMLSTMRRIADELTDSRGLVLRYRPRDGATDGVSGGEGSFLLCTYWLAELLAKAGKVEEAREVFERATAHANDVGLLAEEVESATGELLGNFPQAMSHIGLVNAAWAIAEGEAGGGRQTTSQSEQRRRILVENDTSRYDAVVIGAGQGGAPLAIALANAGWKTAVIEREHVGGTCINVGCTPTKTMVASARVAYVARRASDFGVDVGPVSVNMAAVRGRKQAIVDSWRTGGENRLAAAPGLDLLRGEAEFSGPHSLEVRMMSFDGLGDVRSLTAEHIFINTGARPAVPALPGLDGVPYLDSTSVMELDIVPEHLLVLGGGYVGVEFGQMFRRFGSEVTIIQRGETLLAREDADVAEAVAAILRHDGVNLALGARPVQVEAGRDGWVTLTADAPGGRSTIRGSHLLVAAGRTPNTERLNLAAAGIETDAHRNIVVDERLATGVSGVYALGDVKGGPAFTHISYDDFRILRTNLLGGGGASAADRVVPYVVFMDPQLGRVGLTEAEARERGLQIRVAKMPMDWVARALEVGESRGLMKVVVDVATDRILGCAVLGMEGGEIAALIQIAMMGNVRAAELREAVFAHPTLAESLNNLLGSWVE